VLPVITRVARSGRFPREERKTGLILVRILLDDNIAHNQRTVNSLKGIKNIEIKLDSPQKTTHNKMLIVDGETVLIGSTNWTDSSLGSADEANVIINNKEIAAYLQ
jgi:phosphatidylserine/phosphatidylglycerophosphate/cardiolipin synthase-like enzyme